MPRIYELDLEATGIQKSAYHKLIFERMLEYVTIALKNRYFLWIFEILYIVFLRSFSAENVYVFVADIETYYMVYCKTNSLLLMSMQTELQTTASAK